MYLAIIILNFLPPVVSRQDIHCPGDQILYMCTVFSNSEMLELSWTVTFPEEEAFIIQLYTNDTETRSEDMLEMNVTARLLNYTFSDIGIVVSSIELTLLQDVLVDGIVLECSSEDLASQNVTVFFNTSGKQKNLR